MGFLDELKKMTRPYDDDDEFFDDEDEAIPVAEEPAPARPAQARPAQARPAAARRPAPAPKRSAFVHDEPSESERPAPSYAPRGDSRAADKVVNLNNGGGQLKVVVAAPKQFEAASEIAEHLRSKHAVVLNLESTNKDVARRLVDFLSGCAYALDGKIKKIAISTYIITPYNVDFVGDNLMDELENNGVYL